MDEVLKKNRIIESRVNQCDAMVIDQPVAYIRRYIVLEKLSRTDDIAVPASQVNIGAQCGDSTKTDACVIKYHKYTGLPK